MSRKAPCDMLRRSTVSSSLFLGEHPRLVKNNASEIHMFRGLLTLVLNAGLTRLSENRLIDSIIGLFCNIAGCWF